MITITIIIVVIFNHVTIIAIAISNNNNTYHVSRIPYISTLKSTPGSGNRHPHKVHRLVHRFRQLESLPWCPGVFFFVVSWVFVAQHSKMEVWIRYPPWKWMVGILVSFWGPAHFQVRTVSFREGIGARTRSFNEPIRRYRWKFLHKGDFKSLNIYPKNLLGPSNGRMNEPALRRGV